MRWLGKERFRKRISLSSFCFFSASFIRTKAFLAPYLCDEKENECSSLPASPLLARLRLVLPLRPLRSSRSSVDEALTTLLGHAEGPLGELARGEMPFSTITSPKKKKHRTANTAGSRVAAAPRFSKKLSLFAQDRLSLSRILRTCKGFARGLFEPLCVESFRGGTAAIGVAMSFGLLAGAGLAAGASTAPLFVLSRVDRLIADMTTERRGREVERAGSEGREEKKKIEKSCTLRQSKSLLLFSFSPKQRRRRSVSTPKASRVQPRTQPRVRLMNRGKAERSTKPKAKKKRLRYTPLTRETRERDRQAERKEGRKEGGREGINWGQTQGGQAESAKLLSPSALRHLARAVSSSPPPPSFFSAPPPFLSLPLPLSLSPFLSLSLSLTLCFPNKG